VKKGRKKRKVSEVNETIKPRSSTRQRSPRKRKRRNTKQKDFNQRLLLGLAGLLIVVVLISVFYRQSFCYHMMVGDQVIAQVSNKKEAGQLWNELLKSQSQKLGQEVVVAGELRFEKVSKKRANPVAGEELKKAIETQVDYLTEAYVVRVDGEPLFSLLDGAKVESILEEYKQRFEPEFEEEVKVLSIGFKEQVEVGPELVSIDEIGTVGAAWAKLDTLKVPDTVHEIKKGDNFWDVAIKYDTTLAELLQLNPEAVPERLMPGDKILIKPGTPQLSVLVTLETTVLEQIPAPTKYIDDSSLLATDRRVVDEGAPGEKEVTYQIVLENGYESTMEVLEEVIIKEPVERVIKRGTRTVLARGVGGRNYGVVSASRVTSNYGYRTHPIYKTRRFHEGVDFAAPVGRSVHAYSSGTVTFAGRTGALGLAVYINHGNGLETRYGHLSKINVKKGQKVSTGDKIGAVGSTGLSTGPHLHFEVRKNGKAQNPWDYI
jgi:murein DD-endopeptidase MepM/ murein hydrolase activator NlpD